MDLRPTLLPTAPIDSAPSLTAPGADFAAAERNELLHVSPASALRSIDEIETDFLSALCETAPR